MDRNTSRNTSKRLADNLKTNIRIIFLGGVFVALLFAAYNIVMTGMVKYKYTMAYQAKVKAFPHFKEESEGSSLTEEDCTAIIYSQDFCKDIKGFVEDYVDYNEYIKNISVEVENNTIVVTYCCESMEIAKRIASEVYDEMESKLQEKGKVVYLELVGDVEADKVKKKMESEVKIGITQTIEIGMVLGMIIAALCVTIGYLGRKNIINENDVYKHFNIPVLAIIPPIDEKGDDDE